MRYFFLWFSLVLTLEASNMNSLIWQDSSDAKSVKKDWEGAVRYCNELVLGKKNDWRLPTIKELQSIVEIKEYKPAIKRGFNNVAEGYYWTSTEDASTVDYAWNVSFQYGNSSSDLILNEFYVRCVRED